MMFLEQGVALTGRNTTGPPRAVVTLHMRLVTDDDDRRRQTPASKAILAH